jgi:hypothetical protein
MPPMPERHGTTRASFEQDILPHYQPVVMRGLVQSWPLVCAQREGLEALLRHLLRFDSGQPVDALLAKPDALRSFTYTQGLEGFNFVHGKRPLAALFEQLWRYAQFDEPPCLAVQSALISEVLPGLERENPCPLLGPQVQPRIWVGNRVTVPAHFDDSYNVACVAAGRRRFTLLPPQCAPLLYMGPPEYAPTPAPMTVASLKAPDLQRFPLLAEALARAWVAELEPGDALYIPPLWFHQVEALEPLNVLVNYWWRPEAAPGRPDDTHFAALRLCMLAFRHLPDGEREGWRALLNHYVFGARDAELAHIPEAKRGLLGEIGPELDAQTRAQVMEWLRR